MNGSAAPREQARWSNSPKHSVMRGEPAQQHLALMVDPSSNVVDGRGLWRRA
jgi:hypothetical protein